MPGFDMKFDQQTGDYIETADGDFETTNAADTAVRHQTLDELGQWVGDPDAGSRLFQITRKSTERRAYEMKGALESALDVLVEEGILVDSEVAIDRTTRGKLALRAAALDAQQNEVDITPMLPMNEGT